MQMSEGGRMPMAASCVVASSLAVLSSCGFTAGKLCSTLDKLSTTPLTSESSVVVMDAPNTLRVVHGMGCARLANGDFIKVEQSIEFPGYVNRATVFLNGWDLRYEHSDHHVSFLAATLGKITLARNKLSWAAIGKLADDNGDDPYSFCYRFTALGWNTANLSAEIEHGDALTFCAAHGETQANLYWAPNDQADTALAAYRSYLQNDAFIPYRTAAVLPRGFGMGFRDGSDHHILQLAYNLDHAEAFVEHNSAYRKGAKSVVLNLPNAAQRVGAGYVSWQSYEVFKDDDDRRGIIFGEIVSGMAGADVAVVNPPFAILPLDPVAALVGSTQDRDIVVENVPYEFAIPMLTGWDVGYGNDQHVQEAGVWIERFTYGKDPNMPTGTLRYRIASRLRDKDGDPGHYRRHRVTILGLRAAGGPVTGMGAAP